MPPRRRDGGGAGRDDRRGGGDYRGARRPARDDRGRFSRGGDFGTRRPSRETGGREARGGDFRPRRPPREDSGKDSRDGDYRSRRPAREDGGGYSRGSEYRPRRPAREDGGRDTRGGYGSRGARSGDRPTGFRPRPERGGGRDSAGGEGPYRSQYRHEDTRATGGRPTGGRPRRPGSGSDRSPGWRGAPARQGYDRSGDRPDGRRTRDEGDEPRSLRRAATTGRNLWTPPPPGSARPGRASKRGGTPAGVRRSTNVVGGEQVEGRQAVRELLAAGKRRVAEVLLVEGNDPSPILGEIDNLARAAGVPVRMLSDRRLEAVQRTDTPQGVVAFAEPIASSRLEDLATAGEGSEAVPFLVVVDGVTDPHNLGAILRSAECAGATGAVLPRHRAVHITAAVTKAAAGAVEHLPVALVAGIPSALQALEKLGVRTVGLDERADTSLFDLPLGDEPVALVLGAEGRGLAPLTKRRCEVLARIPLHGAISSLNVSTAAALACFEVARRRERS